MNGLKEENLSFRRWTIVFGGLLALLCLLFVADLCFGSVSLPLSDMLDGEPFARVVLWEIRLPKALMALLTGSALALSGLMMQTFFRNPLAGPYVLGVSSGASLGVAVFLMFLPFVEFSATDGWAVWGCAIFALLGAFGLFLVMTLVSVRLRDSVSLLVVGMLLGAAAGSAISVLQHLSDPDSVKLFVNWTLGSLSMVGWAQLRVVLGFVAMGLVIVMFLVKSLDPLLLGEDFAEGVGVDVRRVRLGIIFATVLLTGVTTAFTGPIGFVGLAAPHVARLVLGTSVHRYVEPCAALLGACMLLLSDVLSQLPRNGFVLPINAVTALLGIPVVLWIILRRKK